MVFATLDTTTDYKKISDTAGCRQALPYVAAMLRNVHLSYDDKSHVLKQEGDFWYWKLTYYGLDLMRLLVWTANNAFSYAETFEEPELENIPQLMLLAQLNNKIDLQLTHPSEPRWGAILDDSPYLHDKDVVIDLELFQFGIEDLIERIQQSSYSYSGNKVYLPRTVKSRDMTNCTMSLPSLRCGYNKRLSDEDPIQIQDVISTRNIPHAHTVTQSNYTQRVLGLYNV